MQHTPTVRSPFARGQSHRVKLFVAQLRILHAPLPFIFVAYKERRALAPSTLSSPPTPTPHQTTAPEPHRPPTMTISFDSTLQSIRTDHHTSPYRSTLPIARRGFPLRLQSNSTSFTLKLVHAHPADSHRRPFSTLTVSDAASSDGWTLSSSPNGFVTLNIPPNAPIGLYELSDSDSMERFALIFNPFSPDDTVYLPDHDHRQEYVMNEAGLIWRGSATSNRPAAWDYAHFNMRVLMCALAFLDKLPVEKRSDPVAVSRHLSAVVNAQDDAGVISGRWDGSYENGTAPSAWTGSLALLSEYWRTRRPVRYGQCWVFAGVLTSVCRTLGLPCRTVSNFSSAHDTDRPYNRAVDMYFDADGDPIEERTSDSIWNFHVWNSAWMKRPDLAQYARTHNLDFDGWQVLDATPQERSSGLFQLGPAPVTAIKHGISLKYDTDFVIGEVNADVILYWQKEGTTDEFVVRDKRTRHVGKFISTKAVGSNRRNDVTLEYKFAEGTPEERRSLANRPSSNITPRETGHHFSFSLSYEPRVKVEDTIVVTLKATNKSSTTETVHFSSLYRAIRYTGAPVARVGQASHNIQIPPGETAQFSIDVPPERYLRHLARDVQTIKFINSAKVVGSDESWAEECIIRLYGDNALQISAPTSVELGESARVTATVINSFRVPLTNVVIRASGEGIADPTTIRLGRIEPRGSSEAVINLDPSDAGNRMLVVTLDTDELKDISKNVDIRVVDNSGLSPWESFLASLRRRGDWSWADLLRD